jgi:hypothetical protein
MILQGWLSRKALLELTTAVAACVAMISGLIAVAEYNLEIRRMLHKLTIDSGDTPSREKQIVARSVIPPPESQKTNDAAEHDASVRVSEPAKAPPSPASTPWLSPEAQEPQYRRIAVAPDVSVVYPSFIFNHEQRTPDGLMAVLYNSERNAMLTVTKAANKGDEPASVRKFYEGDQQATVTYFVNRRGFFVISGYKKGALGKDVFYLKRLRLTEGYAEINIEYPASQKSQYDPITEQISKSFVIRKILETGSSKNPTDSRKVPRAQGRHSNADKHRP